MGWSWALYWCQRIHEVAAEAGGASPSSRLQDGRAIPALDGPAHLEYVDNFAALGTEVERVRGLVRSVGDVLRTHQLEAHDV